MAKSGSSCTCQEEIKGLKEDLSHSHYDMGLAMENIAYLQLEVLAERMEKEDAFERAYVTRLDSEELKARSKEDVAL